MSSAVQNIDVDIELTEKQFQCYQYLTDPKYKDISEVYYIGSSGTGKTFLGCVWQTIQAIQHLGSRHLVGRHTLISSANSIKVTFEKVFVLMKIEKSLYRYYSKESKFTFWNGSEINFVELKDLPGDPTFDRIGSQEYTSVFLPEIVQISQNAYAVAKSRIRYGLTEYGLTPKLFADANPSQGSWVKSDIYDKWKEGTLEPWRKYIPATKSDNIKFRNEFEFANLEQLPKAQRERLLVGSWEYAQEGANRLFETAAIEQMFLLDHIEGTGEKWLCVDPSGAGKDRTVIAIWDGLKLLDVDIHPGKDTTNSIVDRIKFYCKHYNIFHRNIIIDKVGLGQGVYDSFRGAKGFVANARPVHPKRKLLGDRTLYKHLKDQVFDLFAQKCNQGEIYIAYNDADFQRNLTVELLAIEWKDLDSGDPMNLVSKKEMKRKLGGKSPDLADALALRFFPISEKFFKANGPSHSAIFQGDGFGKHKDLRQAYQVGKFFRDPELMDSVRANLHARNMHERVSRHWEREARKKRGRF